MRRIGTLEDGSLARRFCDYLLTLDIDAAADKDQAGVSGKWDIWIRNEEEVERARSEWAQFQQSPDAPHYDVAEEAARVRDRRVELHLQRMRSHLPSRQANPATESQPDNPSEISDAAESRQPGIPLTIAIIIISVAVSFTSHFGTPRRSRNPQEKTLEERTYDAISFVDRRDYAVEGDPFASIKNGQLWRLVTPMFLHADEFHLAFNMFWIFFFGSAIERSSGSVFLLALVLITQTAGMLVQVSLPSDPGMLESLRGSPFDFGASGAVYGLFGFLWIRPLVDRAYPVRLVPINVVLMIGWLVACWFPAFPNVANGAHLGGLIAGVFVAVMGRPRRR
mgnify:CR=1 FL=1